MELHSDQVILGKNFRSDAGTILGALPLKLEITGGKRGRQEIKGRLVIEDNVDVGANCVLNLGWEGDTIIREGVFIGHLSSIGHDAIIGKHTSISAHVCICGHVEIGEWCYIAPQTVIKPYVKIGDFTMIGMGSVVTRDIPKGVIAFGSPCEVQRENLWRPDRVNYV